MQKINRPVDYVSGIIEFQELILFLIWESGFAILYLQKNICEYKELQ